MEPELELEVAGPEFELLLPVPHSHSVLVLSAMNCYLPVYEGRVAVVSFSLSVASLLALAWNVQPLIVVITESICLALLALFYSKHIGKVVFISYSIGVVFATGFLMALSGELYKFFGVYLICLTFFHLSEYVTTSIFNAHTLSIDSFLINHSREYAIAAIVSWIEYGVEFYFFPQLKSFQFLSIIGVFLTVFGESLRKIAMFTAGSNFTHIVQYRKKDSHKLVTSGVYGLFRHPSYVGWFYWSVGTQVLLCNPISLIGYAAATYMFFNERIFDEEECLIQFFKEDYVQYKKTVGTGIPGITGYPLDKVPKLLKLYSS